MKRPRTILLAASALLISSLACTIAPWIPDLGIRVPTIEAGEEREERHTFPLAPGESASIDLAFGAGRLQLEAGAPENLLSGYFLYNVAQWTPQIAHEGNHLAIRQGGDEGRWGVPSGTVRNRWELQVSPQVPLHLDLRAGAAEGQLDFTGLQVASLDVNIGTGSFTVRFDEPNRSAMDRMTLDAGASRIEMVGVGNASPGELRVQGGVGDISVDLTGDWAQSADIEVRAGAGALTLRLPEHLGVVVEVRKGLANVDAYGLRQMGGTYTNDRFGETEIGLDIDIIAGVGNVRLVVEGVTE